MDALTLTEGLMPTQIKQPTDAAFEIQFSVGLKTQAIAYNDDSPRRRVTDSNETPLRIDSQGYRVDTVAGTERRTLATQPAITDLMPTGGGDQRLVTLDTSPSSNYNSSDHTLRTDDEWNTPVGNYYVDSSDNVYDANGKAVYIRRATSPSSRTVTKSGTDPATNTAYSPLSGVFDYTYTRAQFEPETVSNPVSVEARFDYNEEGIQIFIEKRDKCDFAVITLTTPF